jgi:hypothetical protein
MTYRFSIILFGAALALSGSALGQSAQLAKEGTFESKLCFSGPVTPLVVSDTERYGTYKVTAATQSDNKTFDALKMECVAAYEMRSRVWQHRGYCVFQDASGDKFHGSDTLTTDGGYKVAFLGGTGKFAGFSGEGTVKMIEDDGARPAPGTLKGCRQINAQYKMP